MMLRALEALTKARLQGARPAVVMVTLGGEQRPWWQDGSMVEIVIPDDSPVARIDFRALVRCDVIVVAGQRDERLRRVVELIRAQATCITVLSSTDPDDLGHVWSRSAGWRKFGDGPMREAA